MRRCFYISISIILSGIMGWWAVSGMTAEPTTHKGLTVISTTEVDLGPDIAEMQGRNLRTRMYRLDPGGQIASHNHKVHQAIAYIIQGTLTEHRDGQIIRHHAGETFAERSDIKHWHENTGTEPVLFFAADISWPGR
jgi:quercetin dioxygenase-like cupin family protein